LKIAVTGATGHIGNTLSRELLHKGHTLRILARNPESIPFNGDFEIFRGHLFDEESIDNLLSGCDMLIHLAAIISINPGKRDLIFKTNINGPEKMIEGCLKNGVKKIIHVSSIHAHRSTHASQVINESSEYETSDKSAYDYSKYRGEQLMLKAREKGLKTVIVNPTGVLGPHDYKPSLSGRMIMDVYNGKMPFIISGGFDWVDVRDVAKAICSIIDKNIENDKFIIPGHWVSLREMSHLICQEKNRKYAGFTLPIWLAFAGIPFIRLWSSLTGKEPLYTKMSLRTIKFSSRKISRQHAKEILDYETVSFQKSIHDTVEWFKKHKILK
jgi:nucleoside-diphosphate-sugar epimerase